MVRNAIHLEIVVGETIRMQLETEADRRLRTANKDYILKGIRD